MDLPLWHRRVGSPYREVDLEEAFKPPRKQGSILLVETPDEEAYFTGLQYLYGQAITIRIHDPEVPTLEYLTHYSDIFLTWDPLNLFS